MIYVLAVTVGLCAGSFINALVWRVREQSKSEAKKEDKALSILRGRSVCPHCRHELAWYDLLPVFSWLTLRGRCRYCHKSISTQYPLVELLTAGLFLASAALWPRPLTGEHLFSLLSWWILLTGLIALFIYDLRWMLLPNRIVYPLIGIAVITRVVQATVFNEGPTVLLGAVWGFLVAGGLFYVLFQLSQGKWIGGGDGALVEVDAAEVEVHGLPVGRGHEREVEDALVGAAAEIVTSQENRGALIARLIQKERWIRRAVF